MPAFEPEEKARYQGYKLRKEIDKISAENNQLTTALKLSYYASMKQVRTLIYLDVAFSAQGSSNAITNN